jgi:hypothetical protein
MTLAIMQPYLFPYIGYFQLMNAADKFVFYDDVNFIKQGWINRNRILQNGQPFTFTVPVKNLSSFTKIKDTLVDENSYAIWQKKFVKTLSINYSKAPFFLTVLELVKRVLPENAVSVSELAKKSVMEVCQYLSINTEIVPAAEIYCNTDLNSQARVIDICKQENASRYINVAGGIALYNYPDFEKENIELNFIHSNSIEYKQFGAAFQPFLSIIDVLMFCPVPQVRSFLKDYQLIKNKV